MTVNFTPSLSMALFDFVPVILFLIGSIYLGRFMKRHTTAFTFILYVVGIVVSNFAGFAKASWKLMLATGQQNIVWMDDCQFLFLGIGLTLVFISIFSSLQRERKKGKSIPAAALVFTVKGTNLFYYLLTLVVATTIGYISCLVIYSKRVESKISMVMYIAYAVISILMGGLSGSGEHEIVNWIAQSINTLGTFALLIAHYNLNKKDMQAAKETLKSVA